jgi:hypothetical protein
MQISQNANLKTLTFVSIVSEHLATQFDFTTHSMCGSRTHSVEYRRQTN